MIYNIHIYYIVSNILKWFKTQYMYLQRGYVLYYKTVYFIYIIYVWERVHYLDVKILYSI